MFSRVPTIQHVYHHYESPPCSECGYRSNTGYFERDQFMDHLLHTIRDSEVLAQRLAKGVATEDKDEVA